MVQSVVPGPGTSHGNSLENVHFKVPPQTYWIWNCGVGAQKSVFSQTLQEILIMLEFENHCCGLAQQFTPKSTLPTKTLIKHLQRNRLFYPPCASKYRTLHHNRTKLTNKQTEINKQRDSKLYLQKTLVLLLLFVANCVYSKGSLVKSRLLPLWSYTMI